MATLRDLQGKAKKLLVKWEKEYSGMFEKDRRSPVSHLCMTILMRNNSAENADKAVAVLRKRFVDWNEIRVSPVAEVTEALEEAGTPHAEQKAYALRRFLRAVFSKYTKTNLYFDLMDIPEVIPVPVPGEKPEPGDVVVAADDEDEESDAVTRESGLPNHPEVPGYVDMKKVLEQPVPLDPKLITEKNGIHVAGITWDDAERGPFVAMWRVALTEGLVEPELEAGETLFKLRGPGGDKGIVPDKERDRFAFYSIIYAQKNWVRVCRDSDKMWEKASKAAADANESKGPTGKKAATAK